MCTYISYIHTSWQASNQTRKTNRSLRSVCSTPRGLLSRRTLYHAHNMQQSPSNPALDMGQYPIETNPKCPATLLLPAGGLNVPHLVVALVAYITAWGHVSCEWSAFMSSVSQRPQTVLFSRLTAPARWPTLVLPTYGPLLVFSGRAMGGIPPRLRDRPFQTYWARWKIPKILPWSVRKNVQPGLGRPRTSRAWC